MPDLARRLVRSALSARSVVVATLLGTAMLASPLVMAQAQTAGADPTMVQAHPTSHWARTAHRRHETVEQRIASLHKALEITPDEEADWNLVAQAMRDNAAAMQKLAEDDAARDPGTLTAMVELQTYQKFAQAHVDGLKNLISSFDNLYNSMPDTQKKVADAVFRTFGHAHHSSNN